MAKKSFLTKDVEKDNPALQFISNVEPEAQDKPEKKAEPERAVKIVRKESLVDEMLPPEEKPNRTEDLQEFKMYSLTELEGILGVTHRTLLTYITTGKLKGVKIGGKWRVSKANFQDFINGK